MKQADLTPCALCGKGLMHDGHIDFYRVTVERHFVDMAAVQRRHGLELMLGSAVLAGVMGPDEDLTIELPGTQTANLCFDCALGHRVIELPDLLAEKVEAKPEDKA